MPKPPGSEWLEKHWNPSDLPNNEWVAATDQGLIANDPSLDTVIGAVKDRNYNLDDVCLAYVSFDLWL